MNAICLRDVTRSFSGRPVLRGVSASAAAGRVVGLLGRNGEGKTTLLRILLDLLAADSGEALVQGLRPDGSGAIRRRTGYVPERPAFHDFMRVAEVLELRRRLFPSWNEVRARELCRRLGLDPASRVAAASKGTLGKLAWVCAAAHEPDVFLLDEPTSGLDALVREELLSTLIAELHERGRTFLIANHRMEELAGVLDEVWVLSRGRLTVRDAQALRSGARRVSGRLKPGARVPAELAARTLAQEGPLAEFAAFDEASARELAGRLGLEDASSRPLPFAETLKVLLREDGGGSHE